MASNLFEGVLTQGALLCQIPFGGERDEICFFTVYLVLLILYLLVLQPLVRPSWLSVAQTRTITYNQELRDMKMMHRNKSDLNMKRCYSKDKKPQGKVILEHKNI